MLSLALRMLKKLFSFGMNDNNSMDLTDVSTATGGGGMGIPFPPPVLNQNSNNDSPHSSGGAEPVVKRVRNAVLEYVFLLCYSVMEVRLVLI